MSFSISEPSTRVSTAFRGFTAKLYRTKPGGFDDASAPRVLPSGWERGKDGSWAMAYFTGNNQLGSRSKADPPVVNLSWLGGRWRIATGQGSRLPHRGGVGTRSPRWAPWALCLGQTTRGCPTPAGRQLRRESNFLLHAIESGQHCFRYPTVFVRE